ncbi:MAG: hypothetical protein GWP70_09035 [Proteobacteria bacterium]|nr:hypothetical protein [Pseudomonadota bacterium]
MGLIARALEAAGIATVCLSSARSITESVGVPRAVYLDYPLGQTAGRAHDFAEQASVLESACRGFEDIRQPGSIVDLKLQWSADDDWKDVVMRPSPPHDGKTLPTEHQRLAGDQRTARHATPQYQHPADADAADPECTSCVFLAPDEQASS